MPGFRTYLSVHVYGGVPRDFVEWVVSVVMDFYSRVGEGPDIVDLNIYSTRPVAEGVLTEEALTLGVKVVGVFPAAHDAWRAIPRIHVIHSEVSRLPRELGRALIIHEAAHTVLHGTPLSYIVVTPGVVKDLKPGVGAKVVYIASVTVKDIDVVTYLLKKGFLRDVINYFKYVAEQESPGNVVDDVLAAFKVLAPLYPLKAEPPSGRYGDLLRRVVKTSAHTYILKAVEESFNALASGDLDARVAKASELLVKVLRRFCRAAITA